MSVLANLIDVIPPATTPFRADGTIVYGAVRSQIDWLIEAGANGIAVGCSTGEGHTLTSVEFERVIGVASEALEDRVPMIAGIIVNSTREAIKRGEAAAARGVAGHASTLSISAR